MATSREAQQLTEAHRVQQQRIRAEFLAQFIPLWQLLDPRRLDETSPGWVAAVLRLIVPFREQSARASVNYFTEFRALEAPAPGRVTPTPARPVPGRSPATPSTPTPRASRRSPARQGTVTPDRPRSTTRRVDLGNGVSWNVDPKVFEPSTRSRVRIEIPDIDWGPSNRSAVVSLNVTGPTAQKQKAAAGKPLQVARDESFVHAAGAASRHMLTGGRQSLLQLVQADSVAVGWIRVTDGDPCAFCAMLASRGIVYSKAVFARSNKGFDGPGTVKVHDNCACTLEPVYHENAPWPGRAKEFRDLWREVVGFAPNNRYSGQDAINAFRRAYEQQQRDARRVNVA